MSQYFQSGMEQQYQFLSASINISNKQTQAFVTPTSHIDVINIINKIKNIA